MNTFKDANRLKAVLAKKHQSNKWLSKRLGEYMQQLLVAQKVFFPSSEMLIRISEGQELQSQICEY